MKYILLSLFFIFSSHISAQVDLIYPWKLQYTMGANIPVNFNNDQKTSLTAGPSADFVINYTFSEKSFASIKLNYSKHILNDVNAPLAYPVIRTRYFAPMIGMYQNRNKFYFEEKIGFGMFYARQAAYLFQNSGPFLVTKSSDESYSFIAEFNFISLYQFNNFLSIVFNTGVKFSQLKWDITYYNLEQTEDKIELLFFETFNEKIIYLPIVFTVGVAYKL